LWGANAARVINIITKTAGTRRRLIPAAAGRIPGFGGIATGQLAEDIYFASMENILPDDSVRPMA